MGNILDREAYKLIVQNQSPLFEQELVMCRRQFVGALSWKTRMQVVV